MHRHSARPTLARGAAALLAALTAVAPPASGQSLLDRSPNITGGWVGPAGTLHFNFLHRFTAGDAPTRKVNSSPTFLVGGGVPRKAFVGLNYATNSDVAPRYPNEWEFFGRVAPLAQERWGLADLAVQAGYNLAARSVDGELTLTRSAGRVTVLGAARFLSDAFGLGESRAVVAGGAVLRFGPYIAVAGDYAYMPDLPAGFDDAWSAALQLAIPYTPHTFSLQATNTNTATLQGASASRGGLRRYGFEFTIPVTLSRYIRRSTPAPAAIEPAAGDTVAADTQERASTPARVPPAPARALEPAQSDSIQMPPDSALAASRRDTISARRDSATISARRISAATSASGDTLPAQRDSARARARRDSARQAPSPVRPPARQRPPATVVRADIRDLKYLPARLEITAGTIVEWTNNDPLVHTVTADDRSWDSGPIEPGKTFRRRFATAGTFAFHCTPHPFMKGVVVVR